MQWAGEDWGSPAAPEHLLSGEDALLRNADKTNEAADVSSSPPSTTATSATKTTEVKIKITKKQLEELLGKVEVQGLSVHQLLDQLMNASDRFVAQQRSWRPALQSIPEIN
ncbi:hypothetical protein RHSIM_RhsimUnG0250800 [Rhododendron simsii]|uniref:Uncharacterized protein n=1 Tax=Rhododendron simsii TaxID=118357 RepID=A0A834FT96_RHOSS|nr:hypothetical protein RHSIM_RhsimUnG0250800 [Rhododendron simsii]